MKMKLKLDKESLQEFFFLHVEKIVLGVVVLLLGIFAWAGYQLEALNDSPEILQNNVSETKKGVTNPRNWEGLAIEPTRVVTLDVPEQVAKTTVIDPKDYVTHNPLDVPPIAKNKLRSDPLVLAPVNLRATAFTGPLAIKRLDGAKDPFAPAGGAPKAGPSRPTPTKREPTKTKGATKSGGGGGGGGAQSEYDLENGGQSPDLGMTADGGQPNQGRASERTAGYIAGTDATWTAGNAVVIQAVVPWQQQFEEYRRCFEKAQDFRLDRDLPFYVLFSVERADVTSNPNAKPEDLRWGPIPNYGPTGYQGNRKELESWAGFPSEVLSPDYLDRALTLPAPPFLLRDLTPAMLHPDVPRASQTDTAASKPATEEKRTVGPLGEEILPEGKPAIPNLPQSMEVRSKPVFLHLPPGESIFGRQGNSNETGIPTASTGGNAAPPTIEKAAEGIRKYKLLRFTDTTVKPGVIYRYRVKVFIEDPNHPYVGSAGTSRDPGQPVLDEKVKTRLKALAARETNARIFYRDSDWSAPSPPVSLPSTSSYHAAWVKPPAVQNIREDRPLVIVKDPEAWLVAMKFDLQKKTDVPAVGGQLKRGSTLAFEPKKVEVRHPVTGQIVDLSGYRFDSTAVVADMRGGEPIGKTKFKTPSEILIFDSDNKFHFLNDSNDIDGIRRNVHDQTLLDDKK